MQNKFNSNDEANTVMQLCIGRLFLMGARSSLPNDLNTYEDIKSTFLDACEYLGIDISHPDTTSYQANYNKIYHN